MAIDDRYFRLLDHLGPTLPVQELADDPGREGVALRHDVDHDLHLALEMAAMESERGVRATYFLLHGAAYWDDPQLEDVCRQLAAFGHEVGIHLNALAEWREGRTADPATVVRQGLARLRSSGTPVVGSAAHGDRSCYDNGFINYWVYRELRPTDPLMTESGLSAEGVLHPLGGFSIDYPADHTLRRDDGASFPLWSVSMADLGLSYEAVKVPTDRYFSDSGGSWLRSPDPLGEDLSSGRHQVLVHPEYWRGPQRLYLFLSTARSGSTWLAKVLDEASSVTARHELTLNHELGPDGGLVARKRTGAGFVELLEQPDEARRLMAQARGWMESLPGDVAEANVYLGHFPELVREVFPDAVLVHLHRDPRLVVASILSRDWYDADDDDRHPAVDVPGWADMDQFERCCWSVRALTESLLEMTSNRLPLAEATLSARALSDLVRPLGIAVYPELDRDHTAAVNEARSRTAADYHSWSEQDHRRFDAIVGPVRALLGYEPLAEGHSALTRPARALVPVTRTRTLVLDTEAAGLTLGLAGATLESAHSTSQRTVPTADRHAHVLLGGGTWTRLAPEQGWPAAIAASFRVRIEATADGGTVQVFCLMYDHEGTQVDKRLLGPLRAEGVTEYGFKTRASSERFDLALYSPVTDLPAGITLRRLTMEREDVVRDALS